VEFALALRWPIPSSVLWGIVASVGAATVLSFAMLAELFPTEIAGQANAALNLLHVGAAFLLQSGIGFVIGQWTAAEAITLPPLIRLRSESLPPCKSQPCCGSYGQMAKRAHPHLS
jgi:hypothetical protein